MSLCQKNSIKTLCSYVFMSKNSIKTLCSYVFMSKKQHKKPMFLMSLCQKKQHKGSILFCLRVYASTGSSFYFLFLTFFFLLCKSIAFTA